MPIPNPVEVEDGLTPVKLGDMQAVQQAVNTIIAYLNEHSATIENAALALTEQDVRDLIQEHANQDTDVHGANGANQRILKAVGGGGFLFADRTESEVPVGIHDNDIRIAPPA